VYFGLHDYQPGPRFENGGSARELIPLGSSKQVDLEFYRENDVIRLNHCCGCTAGRMIGNSGLHTGMHETVLLKVAGLQLQF
jgi:hypothetical protein